MSKKPRLLIFIDWYLPAYKAGGPVRSVSNLVRKLKNDFDIYIYTSDRDLGDEKPFDGIMLDEWIPKDGYRVMYNSPDHQNLKTLRSTLKEVQPSMVYINSMFSWSFTILPLWALRSSSAKIVLAPRGMLGKGALSLKPLKKKVFLLLGKKMGLFKNLTWHATGDEEKKEINEQFGEDQNIKVISNIPDLLNERLIREKQSGKLNLLFYSRISPKKNLKYALKVLKNADLRGEVEFHIYGPSEDQEYWNECNSLINDIHKSKSNIRIEYHGPIHPSTHPPIHPSTHPPIHPSTLPPFLPSPYDLMFSSSHLLFFPTKHENYGHVIAEALSSGMPVLLSDNTPWRDLEEQKVGFDLPLVEPKKFNRALQYFIDMGQDAYDIWSANARKFVLEKTNLEEMRSAYKDLFLPNG